MIEPSKFVVFLFFNACFIAFGVAYLGFFSGSTFIRPESDVMGKQLVVIVQQMKRMSLAIKAISSASMEKGEGKLAERIKKMEMGAKNLEIANARVHKSSSGEAEELKSTIECTDLDKPGNNENRTCVFYNFCVSKTGGIFPRYELILTREQQEDKSRITAQLGTFVEQGGQVYETPRLTPPTNFPSLAVTQKKVLFVFAPAAWPWKFPAHTILNNFVPIFRHLDNVEPERRYPHMWQDHVWKYEIDIYHRGNGFVGGAIDENFKQNYHWLGVRKENIWHENAPLTSSQGNLQGFPENQAYCYERVHAGTEGTKSNWRKLFNPYLWDSFRTAVLAMAKFERDGGHCWPVIPQRLYDRPELLFIQRDNFTGNVRAYGPRVVENIDELDGAFKTLKNEGLIRYKGVLVIDKTMTPDYQACYASTVGILIAVHGNALALGTFMEKGTVMIEINAIGPYYKEMCNAVGLVHFNFVSRPQAMNVKPAPLINLVRRAVKIWKHNHRPQAIIDA